MNLLALQEATVEHISGGAIAARLGVVLVLVGLNAFFVASAFALVAVRRSRIDEMAAGGDRAARSVQGALEHLDRYIAGTQLGITIASLALGWVGEPALAVLIDRFLGLFGLPPAPDGAHTAAAIAVSFFIITFLHIVLGELAPKTMALVSPEKVSKIVVTPLKIFSRVMS